MANPRPDFKAWCFIEDRPVDSCHISHKACNAERIKKGYRLCKKVRRFLPPCKHQRCVEFYKRPETD